MIRLVANEATPGLGLASGICRPKMKLRGIRAFILLIFFVIENQATWLSESRDPLGHSPNRNFGLQRPRTPINIAAYFGKYIQV